MHIRKFSRNKNQLNESFAKIIGHSFGRMTELSYLCKAKNKKMTQNRNSYFGFYYYFYFSK